MRLLTKRYTRAAIYVGVIYAGIRLFQFYLKDISKNVDYRLKEELLLESLLQNDNPWLRNHLEDDLIVNIGIESCFQIGSKWARSKYIEGCWFHDEKLFSSQEGIDTRRHTILKDLRGTLGMSLYGTSQYLYFETLSIKDLLIHLHDGLEEVQIISRISSDRTPDSIIFNNLHFQTTKITKETLLQDQEIISEINVLFGDDCVDPRPNWNLLKGQKFTEFKYPSYISYKSVDKFDDQSIQLSPKLLTTTSQDFKIVQLADLHMGVGTNECRDEFPESSDGVCKADPKTLEFIEKVLDNESPQLVVFTGDQIMGDRSIQDSETTLLKALDPVIRRKLPWAMVWGNHDDEGSLSRWQLSELAAKLPYSLFEMSKYDTKNNKFGVGNYAKQVFNGDNEEEGLITLYFLDSHKYSQMGKIYPGYDWIKEEQLNYIEHEYNTKLLLKQSKQKKQLSMAFFHIPLPEYLNLNSAKRAGENNPLVGEFKEGVTAPKYNSGALEKLQSLGVQVTSCGHDHCNDYCLLDDSTSSDIWLCFGGSAGEGAYAGYGGTERRIRVYALNTERSTVYTWKLLNGSPNLPFDYQQLV
ncbi:hypothetical protein KAFR_0A06210 [Kazachstania africana CBS 2517]|uniref:Calcineurin-like phosphoesterase domain-containing protein n=1 Tax=Kazachstania africana (strain ATCC 22294 / BCRC 22015 / CBS 2517 / CECT 1963 / NBRC 1671 / NRRL Y-8276) TaxID=1071382 RepID=H2ANV6_KAZAF|nr:hypothetical protein KAFR_0A06210 [Kazachstania africana CBS 2517]CCF56056.1 hypothetical protein KAFR_0A06210 [Kazachstania africana CBS 2517]